MVKPLFDHGLKIPREIRAEIDASSGVFFLFPCSSFCLQNAGWLKNYKLYLIPLKNSYVNELDNTRSKGVLNTGIVYVLIGHASYSNVCS